jgi:hypothetical protein
MQVGDERCEPCKTAGFPDILAHYKEVPAGRSHDGKRIPPMCWDHKHGKVPRYMQTAEPEPETAGEPESVNAGMKLMGNQASKVCVCGCNTTFVPNSGRQTYATGHRSGPAPRTKTNGNGVLVTTSCTGTCVRARKSQLRRRHRGAGEKETGI